MNYTSLNYVEYSFHGPNNRNKITVIDKLADLIPKGGQDHYVCWFRYEAALLRYVETGHEETDTKTGEVKRVNSVSGHNLPHYCDYVTWDIDDKNNLDQARQHTAALIGKLVALGIEVEKIGLYFSGSKGFHVLVPSSLFDISPSPDLYLHIRALCVDIAGNIPIDTAIYDRNRLFRTCNTRNSKSGLYKVQICLEMLEGTIEAIKGYSKQLQPETLIRNDYPLRKNLKILFVKCAKKGGTGNKHKSRQTERNEERAAGSVPKFQKICFHKLMQGGAKDGHIHDAALRMVDHLNKQGLSYDAIIAEMNTWAEKCDPPATEDFGRMINDCSARGYDFGCNDPLLMSYCDASCTFYKKPVVLGKYDITKQRFTDTGISELVSKHFGDNVRFWPITGKWLFWDGRRWCSDTPGGMFPYVKRIVQELFKYAIEVEDADMKKKILQAVMKLEGHYAQQTIIRAMEVLPELIVITNQLDRDNMLLTCQNGTLALSTGTLKAHDPADLITRIVNIEYDAAATCPKFEAFMHRIFDGNEKLISFVQRFFGYCLTGRTDEQTMCFFYGTGANGKSTLLTLFSFLLSDFAASAQADLLMLKHDGSASNDIARLRGARLVAVNEVNEGAKLDEAKLKNLTGGDVISARFLFQEHFEYIPQFKLVLVGNHKMTIKGRDWGIWRRIHMVPFTVTIPAEERDPYLMDKLKAELPGILSWAVRGCMEWQRGGLMPPDEVLDAVKEYRSSEDSFGTWLQENCERGAGFVVKADELLESFKVVTGMIHITPNKLTKWLKDEGFVQEKKMMGRSWIGLKLKE